MKTLVTIIALHLLAIWAGRNIRKTGYKGMAILILVTLLMVAVILYGMFTLENPKVDHY